MILTIKGADFSGAGIGTNTSVSISYNGNVSGTPGFIEKNKELTSTITIKTGYTYDSISSVTVGGSIITGYTATDNGNGTVTLTIPANLITGKVVVNVNTTATSTGGDEVVEPEEPGTGGGSSEPIVLADDSDYSIDGFVRPAGTIGTAPPYKRTDYIDISGYNFSRLEAFIRCAALTVSPIAFFDENKEFISAVTATEETKDTAYLYSMDVPSNAAYVISSTITGAQYGFTPYLHGYK